MAFSIADFIIAIGAGVFGAALGALPAFIFVGLLVMVGVAIQAATGQGAFIGQVPFGVFGPHVAGFASGVAAAAFAARRGKMPSGRDITAAPMGLNDPATLAIGAAFGGVGYLLNWGFNLVGRPWTDTVALSVVVSAIIARLVFGTCGLFGQPPKGQSRLGLPPMNARWLPWQSEPAQLTLIGLGAGLMSAAIAKYVGADKGGVVLGFAISAASLIFLQFGTKVPVTHHITLSAAVAAAASGSLIWGALFGLIAAFVGELFSRLFLIYGDTHIDPPAAAIATMTSASLLIAALGIYGMIALP